MLYGKSYETIEKLKKVLEQMVLSGVVWNKSYICDQIGVCRNFLAPATGGRVGWQASLEAKRLYQEACDRITSASSVNQRVLVKASTTIAQAQYLENICKELTEENKKLRKAIAVLATKNQRLEQKLKELNGVDAV